MIPAQGDIVSRQVTALSNALNQLRNVESFVRDAVRSLPDATLIARRDGKILMVNERAEQLFGSRVEPGQKLDDLFHSLGEVSWVRLLDPDLVDPGDIRTPDGLVLRPAAAILQDSAGHERGLILSLSNMTTLRAVERQREHAIQLLTHDMRAPQVSILTLMQNDAQMHDPATPRRICAYAQQTLDLAEGFVQLARAESQAYRTTLVDLVQVAMDAADTLWPQALANGVSINVSEADEEFLVMGDNAMLRRLLINLLDNGLKYGPPGMALDCQIDGIHHEGAEFCRLSVRDRGPGLTPEAAALLFQPFGQGGSEQSGVGLGLAFVRTVAERHGGSVRYEAADPGAQFVVTLPRQFEQK